MNTPPSADLVPESLAFPSGLPVGCHDATGCAFGLTKRELFAAMAMQAMKPNDVYAEPWVIAQMAVKRADALLEALKS